MRANLRQKSETPEAREHGWREHRGQILVMFAAGMLLLVGMVALAVDTGFIMAERRQVQSAADAGAMAAAKAKLDYLELADSENAQVTAGELYAAQNASTDQDNVTVDTSPDGYGNEYVQVTVSKDVESFFLRALYDGDWGVSAEAVAGMEDVQLPYALVALNECDEGGQSGIDINGSGTIDVNAGSIMSNCDISRSGDSSVVAAEGAIDAAGDIDEGSQWEAEQGFREGRPPVRDPIEQNNILAPTKEDATTQGSGVDVPAVDDMTDAVSEELEDRGNGNYRCASGDTCVMRPGYYGGDILLDVRGILELQPGIYYFGEDFNLDLQSDGSRVSGSDVMLYFGGEAEFNPHNGQVDIAAPASTPYSGGLDGMALWVANCKNVDLQGGESASISGVIYAPCSEVSMNGSPGARGTQVVAGNLTLSGTGTLEVLYEEYVTFDVPKVFLVQ